MLRLLRVILMVNEAKANKIYDIVSFDMTSTLCNTGKLLARSTVKG